MSGVRTIRRLMETRTRNNTHKSPEELEPGLLLVPGMVAKKVRDVVKAAQTSPGDVIIVSSPKSGTTWLKQTIKLIMNYGEESGMDVDEFCPWFEMLTPAELKVLPSPKVLKTHLPYRHTPGGDPVKNPHVKYIYIYRNPKDSAVSMYHHAKSLYFSDISWDEHFEAYCIKGQVPFGSSVDHVLGWWKHKDADNILILSFEQLKKNSQAAVSTVANFLGYQLSEDVILKIVEQTKFDNMKLNPTANNEWAEKYRTDGATPFMRKGMVGDWRNYFTDEQSARLDELISEKLKDTDLVFDYGDQ